MSRGCAEGLIGPNAAIQLAASLGAGGEAGRAAEIFGAAGCAAWLDAPPRGMVPEAAVARLFAETRRWLPPEVARARAAEAGRRTADYLLAHRIPPMAQRALRRLPAPFALRLLLLAVARHGWTFAGSGRVRARWARPALLIEGNPLAAAEGCEWHLAVLGRLARRLVRGEVALRETACAGAGAPACRFEMAARRRRRAAAPLD